VTSKVVWCNRGWFPVHFGFCPDKKAWNREMKRMGVKSEPYPKSDGRCVTFESSGKVCAIVTVSKQVDGKDSNGVVGLIIHEAVHVWQLIRENIGESNPSPEFEAYAIQAISQELIAAYSETRGAA
jgi:hypothetical protein